MKPLVMEVCDIINTSTDEDILPSPNELPAIKRTKVKNKVAEKILPSLKSYNEKDSRQRPQYLLNESNSFSVQHENTLMENIVREPVFQSTPVFPAGFMHYQSPHNSQFELSGLQLQLCLVAMVAVWQWLILPFYQSLHSILCI